MNVETMELIFTFLAPFVVGACVLVWHRQQRVARARCTRLHCCGDKRAHMTYTERIRAAIANRGSCGVHWEPCRHCGRRYPWGYLGRDAYRAYCSPACARRAAHHAVNGPRLDRFEDAQREHRVALQAIQEDRDERRFRCRRALRDVILGAKGTYDR